MNLVQEKEYVANAFHIIDEVVNYQLVISQQVLKRLIIGAYHILLN
jgi:hypothetical protein